MVLGEHCSLVRRVVPEAVTISTLFFASATLDTASATPELITSVIMSTLPVSYHCRAMLVAMSGLFWWSAEISSTLNEGFSFSTKSSIAICAAVTEPAPAISENRPAMSVSTPILTVPSEMPCVCAGATAQAAASIAAATAARENPVFIAFSLLLRGFAPRSVRHPSRPYSAACDLVSLRRKCRRAQAATLSIVAFVSGRNGKIG
jgi:hypothetical protein